LGLARFEELFCGRPKLHQGSAYMIRFRQDRCPFVADVLAMGFEQPLNSPLSQNFLLQFKV